jgi:hypothetical protein
MDSDKNKNSESLHKDASNMHHSISVLSTVTMTQVCQAKILGFTTQQTTLWIKLYTIYRRHLYSSLLTVSLKTILVLILVINNEVMQRFKSVCFRDCLT